MENLPQASSLTAYPQVAAVVLAAGAARRFGRPKQLERWPGPDSPTLVERAVGLALDSGVAKVYVVVGNQNSQVADLLAENPATAAALPVNNPRWEEGQGFSVAAGVREVQENSPETQAILFMLSDQPRLQAATLAALLRHFETLGEAGAEAIIFPTYGGKRGNPVIFGRAYFEELAALEGDTGGRAVVRAHPGAAIEVAVTDPATHEDVDTPADLEGLNSVTGNDARTGGEGES